jgi:hypothetical protein
MAYNDNQRPKGLIPNRINVPLDALEEDRMLEGLTLSANEIPPEMMGSSPPVPVVENIPPETLDDKYNRLLGQYEDMYKGYSNLPEKAQQDLAAAKAERNRADNIARYADLGQELASAFNIAHGGQGFQATAGDKLRKRGQLGLDEAQQANKNLIAANLEKMKGAEGLLGLYQKTISDKEKRALDREQKDINKGLFALQQNQDRRAAEKSKIELDILKDKDIPQDSKLLEQFIAERYPKYAELVKGKSHAELSTILKQLEEKTPKANDVLAKEDAQIRKENRKLREGLTGAEASLSGQLKQLQEAKKLFESYSKSSRGGTGPLATGFGTKKLFSKDLETLDSTFKKLQLDEMVKLFAGLSKAIDSDAERKAFESTQPNITLDDATNLAILEKKIAAAESLLAKTRSAASKYDRRGNFTDEDETYKKLDKKAPPSRVRVSNGKETLEIDASDLADAEKEGFTKVK